MSESENILVLTTREYDHWASMQEILPALESVWRAVGAVERNRVEFVHVDAVDNAIDGIRSSLAEVTRVVLTAATPATVRAAMVVRRDMRVTAPIVVYSHGDVTTGFEAFGELTGVMTSADQLVVACAAEAAIARHLFTNMTVRVVPWPLVDQYKTTGRDPNVPQPTMRLAYVGRVSQQKNLHTLLLALWLLRRWHPRFQDVRLEVYGGEDGHGSPNMGMPGIPYLDYLKGLATVLDLGAVVEWKGFTERIRLFETVHSQPHVLVTASLHSDENFGSSVLASLANGRQAVATGWGGHLDFARWFAKQLHLVPVRGSTKGPVVHPEELASAIMEAIDSSDFTANVEALDKGIERFSEAGVLEETLRTLGGREHTPTALVASPAQQQLETSRRRFGGGRRIFEDYADPRAAAFFAAYGMGDDLAFDVRTTYLLAPWVHVDSKSVRVDDPHRGHKHISLDMRLGRSLEAVCVPSLERCSLPEPVLANLATQGYAFSL